MAENLLEALKESSNTLLRDQGLYSVMDYAWEDEDTPSARYVGLAIWQTDPPFKIDLFYRQHTKPPQDPTDRDEFFLRAGEDFVGVMELARNAIGITLYCHAKRRPYEILDDEDNFWEYRAIAAQWLNIASDRIRDYFVMGRFGLTSKRYGSLGKGHGQYPHPFIKEDRVTPEAGKVLLQLRPLVNGLAKRRSTRNIIVHEVASRGAWRAHDLLRSQRKQARQVPFIARNLRDSMCDLNAMREAADTLRTARVEELNSAVDSLKSWYMSLVESGSLVFEFEYWKRMGR